MGSKVDGRASAGAFTAALAREVRSPSAADETPTVTSSARNDVAPATPPSTSGTRRAEGPRRASFVGGPWVLAALALGALAVAAAHMRKVRVRVVAGPASVELVGQGSMTGFNTWSGAASGAAKQVETWLAARRDPLR